jgi:hypothetical protein
MKYSIAPRLRISGATDSVTGSRFLLEFEGRKVLVDCGLFQGYRTFETDALRARIKRDLGWTAKCPNTLNRQPR